MKGQDENFELIVAAKNGDKQALSELININAESVHSFIYSIVGNWQIVEDLAQETFLRMITAIKNYEFRAPFRAWLFRIAVNLCRDHFRRKKVRNIVSSIIYDSNEEELNLIDETQNPARDLESKETIIKIEQAMNSLPESLRMVFVLRDIQEFTYEEIAKTLKWSLGTVKSRLFRARKEIAKYIIQQGRIK